MVRETLGIFAVMLMCMTAATVLIPIIKPKIKRSILVVSFIPSLAFMMVGMLGYDFMIVNKYASTSMLAIAVFLMIISPQLTFIINHLLRENKSK